MFNDFKKFIIRGNVMDLAVGVIIGGAFGKIVSSLVADVIMPFVSVINGGVSFSGLQVRIAGTDAAPVFLAYGRFIQSVIDFLIIGAVVFMMVRLINRQQKPVEQTTRSCPRCTMTVSLKATRCPYCTSELAA
ncbi:MAG: large conductance mechanosensitive channel protein MscL [Candidatus Kerfeldbacteria bacterium]|nr:large conductance mechanosensitive channel protein MscL [Candidatus Kerfeldbacteria bacterium]